MSFICKDTYQRRQKSRQFIYFLHKRITSMYAVSYNRVDKVSVNLFSTSIFKECHHNTPMHWLSIAIFKFRFRDFSPRHIYYITKYAISNKYIRRINNTSRKRYHARMKGVARIFAKNVLLNPRLYAQYNRDTHLHRNPAMRKYFSLF